MVEGEPGPNPGHPTNNLPGACATTRLTSFLGDLFTGTTAPKTVRTTALGVQTLEACEVPTIDLLGGQLTITGGAHNDSVGVIGPGSDVVTHVKATRLETRVVNDFTTVFQESKTFAAGAVTSVRAELGEGTNSFTNNTAKTSVVIGGSGRDTLTGGVGTDYLHGNGGDDGLRGAAAPTTSTAGPAPTTSTTVTGTTPSGPGPATTWRTAASRTTPCLDQGIRALDRPSANLKVRDLG